MYKNLFSGFSLAFIFTSVISVNFSCREQRRPSNTPTSTNSSLSTVPNYLGLALGSLPPADPGSLTVQTTAITIKLAGITSMALSFTNDQRADAVAYKISGPKGFILEQTTSLQMKVIDNLPQGILNISVRSCLRPERSTSKDSKYLVTVSPDMGTLFCNDKSVQANYLNKTKISTQLTSLFVREQNNSDQIRSNAYNIYKKIQAYVEGKNFNPQESNLNSFLKNIVILGPDYFLDWVNNSDFDDTIIRFSKSIPSLANTDSSTQSLTWDPNNLSPVFLALISVGAFAQQASSSNTQGLGLVSFSDPVKQIIAERERVEGYLTFVEVQKIVRLKNAERIEAATSIQKMASFKARKKVIDAVAENPHAVLSEQAVAKIESLKTSDGKFLVKLPRLQQLGH